MKVQESLDKLAIIANQKSRERDYWTNKLAGKPGKSAFPYDRKEEGGEETDENKNRVNTIKSRFQPHLFQRLLEVSSENDYTLHVILTAGVTALLNRYTGQRDIIVAVPIYKQETEGEYMNTVLPLRVQLNEKNTVKDLLMQVKQTVAAAVAHQSYPVKILLDRLNDPRQEGLGFKILDTWILLRNIQDEKDIATAAVVPSITFSFLRHDGYLEAAVHYRVSLYRETAVRRIISHLEQWLGDALRDVDAGLSQVETVSHQEKKWLLEVLNDTAAGYPRDKTIHRLFEEQVARGGDRVAVIGGTRGTGRINHAVSYGQLNSKADRTAHLLQKKGVASDVIVGIMAERRIETVAGILAILKAGGAYLPIDPGYPEERKQYMLKESGARILLTLPGDSSRPSWLLSSPGGGSSQPCHLHLSPVSATSLAYIIYTSGTTGGPKGAMIRHRNVVRLMKNDRFLFDFSAGDTWTLFHSLCFDFSVWEMYGALLYGGKLVVVPVMAARDSRTYLEILKKHQVTVLNQTPSAFYQLMNLELANSKKELNTRYIIFGGEALAPARLKKWRARYPGTTLVNMYGITETTVHVTFKEIRDPDIQSGASTIGQPIPTLSAYVVDRNLKLLPVGVAGELCVGGEGVGRGYGNRPALTAEKFVINPYNPAERLYRSGDLVKLSGDGDIEYLGRIDHQVKIRGFRIELGEIENCLLIHSEIEEAVVLAKESESGDKDLCAYAVFKKEKENSLTAAGLREFLLKHLPDYMVPSYFVSMDKMPLTANGKIDREVLPEPGAQAGKEYTAPRDEIEKKLTGLWAKVLGVGEPVGIDDDFFTLGGHSLKATLLVADIHKELAAKVPLAEVFKRPTVRGLSQYIRGAKKDRHIVIEPSEKKDFYVLSSAQKRLYILRQMDETGTTYNLPTVVEIVGVLYRPTLEKTFAKLIDRHESLRTSFLMIDEEPMQKIHDRADFKIEYHTPAAPGQQAVQNIIKNFIRPFDLARAPLLRVGLITMGEENHILMADMHHIVSDGTSRAILLKEFAAIYTGEEIPALKIQYKNYSEWLNGAGIQEVISQQEAYWLKEFEKEIPEANLPLDYPRGTARGFEGHAVRVDIAKKETQALKTLALKEDATLFMVLLAIYIVLSAKITGREDIVVGTGVGGRRHGELQGLIGMFVNTLALRTHPAKEKTFKAFLSEVREKTLLAFENQDYQFEDLVEKILPTRPWNRNPLFDTAFVFRNPGTEPAGIPAVELPGLIVEPYEWEHQVSRFDMTFFVREADEELMIGVEYATALFKKETIEMFIDYFCQVVSIVTGNSGILLKDIALTQDIREVDTGAPQYAFQF